MTYPGIKDVGVVGMPDARCGEVPFAFVVRNNLEVTEIGIMRYVKGTIQNLTRRPDISTIVKVKFPKASIARNNFAYLTKWVRPPSNLFRFFSDQTNGLIQ